jgi:hypothetical protein
MTTEVPRLNGAIRALEAGKPVFVSLANAEIGIAQAIGAAPHEGVVFEMEHNPFDADVCAIACSTCSTAAIGLSPTVTPFVRIPPNGGELKPVVCQTGAGYRRLSAASQPAATAPKVSQVWQATRQISEG